MTNGYEIINPEEVFTQPRPKIPQDVYALESQEQRVKNLIQQISPDNQLMEIQWRIKGYIKNPVTEVWDKIDEKLPEPNPILVARYISYLSSILNQSTTLSNLSSSEINNIMKLIIQYLADDLDANGREYELESNYTERTRIGHIILNNTFMALKRAQNGMESRRIFQALNIGENLSPYQPEKKRGWKDALAFWRS